MIKTDYFFHSDNCPYIIGKNTDLTFCYAAEVTSIELSRLLAKGWRKFGQFYFKNNCRGCYQCLPIRIPVKKFVPSKSQRRLLRKNQHIKIIINPLQFRPEIYNIYCDHSHNKLNRTIESMDEFVSAFYIESCPSIQTEYYIDGDLAGVGFIDIAGNALSSVYFIYKYQYQNYSLGNYSILKEIELAKTMKKNYYYLGYFVEGNLSIKYKNQFFPNEKMNWKNGKWTTYNKIKC